MVDDAEDFSTLHEQVLRFMGAFSTTQFAIDTIIGLYLRRRMPSLGAAIEEQFLTRVRDDQRLPLFKAFAQEAGYGADLTLFDRVYDRAKKTRDFIGHSLGMVGPVLRADGPPYVAVTHTWRPTQLRNMPDPLFPSTFGRLTVDCEWMTKHVHRAGYEAEPDMYVNWDRTPAPPPTAPGPSPLGGEPFTS